MSSIDLDSFVLFFNVMSLLSLLRINSQALSTGIAVNSDITSNETMISSSSILVP